VREHREGSLITNGGVPDLRRRFLADVLRNANNEAILRRLPSLGLPDAWLVAGCLFQTVWNLRCGRPADAGIRDYDIFYFDGSDLSADAEHHVDEQLRVCFADLPVTLEAKNQARVHIWYPDYFGVPYEASTCSRDGIDRFLVECTCVGLRTAPDGPELYAPNGLQALYEGLLRPNPRCDQPALFAAKAADYWKRWPWLRIRQNDNEACNGAGV